MRSDAIPMAHAFSSGLSASRRCALFVYLFVFYIRRVTVPFAIVYGHPRRTQGSCWGRWDWFYQNDCCHQRFMSTRPHHVSLTTSTRASTAPPPVQQYTNPSNPSLLNSYHYHSTRSRKYVETSHWLPSPSYLTLFSFIVIPIQAHWEAHQLSILRLLNKR